MGGAKAKGRKPGNDHGKQSKKQPAKHVTAKSKAERGGSKNAKPLKSSTMASSKHTGQKVATTPHPAVAEHANRIAKLVGRMQDQGIAWYNLVKPLPSTPAPTGRQNKKHKVWTEDGDDDDNPAADEAMEKRKREAQALLEQEVARYEAKKSSKMSSDDKYLGTMMKSGTLSDRVAALTLTVQSSPFHALARLQQLISMANKKARRESLMAVDSLKDLFLNNLLPDDRKLRFFHQNPLTHKDVTPEHLVVWYFEHHLKTAFAQLVGVLSNGMNDAVDNHKRACIRTVNALLSGKPEQESVLLAMLVNKLGDPDRKIASYIHKTLQDLLREHPVMKRVVVDEVERLLTRPKVTDRTKYHAVLFLNQLYLDSSAEDAALASHLITVYFGLFSKEVREQETQTKGSSSSKKDKKQGKAKHEKAESRSVATAGLDRKLLSSLLVGVNRAFPYAKEYTSAQFESEVDALFVVVHRAHLSTSVQALMLLFQVMSSTNSVSDRFYTALYAKLFDPKLRETTKHTLFLNLIFRALKADVSPGRTCAIIKRLLQLATIMSPAFACAALFLISEVLKVKPQLRTLIDEPEPSTVPPTDEEHFQDVPTQTHEQLPEEYLEDQQDNAAEDTDEEGNSEETSAQQDPEVNEEERAQKLLESMFSGNHDNTSSKSPNKTADFGSTTTLAPVSTNSHEQQGYDAMKRNPLFAQAETSCAWELHHFVHHYHPSVQQFARQLIQEKAKGVQYAGDPLVDFTMHAFFEKFMNKKPRHRIDTRTSGEDTGAGKGWTFVPINSEQVLEAAEDSIDESDKFFYKFFKERAAREEALPPHQRRKNKSKKKRDDDQTADVFSDEDEEEDEEMEAFAQQLAEGIMQDGDMDDEDPDMEDWSGPEDDDESNGNAQAALEDEFDFPGASDDEADADGAMMDDEDDHNSNDSDEEASDGDLDNSDLVFGGDSGDDEEIDHDLDDEDVLPSSKAKDKQAKAPKRKSPFASADDYDEMVRQAELKQRQRSKNKNKRPRQS